MAELFVAGLAALVGRSAFDQQIADLRDFFRRQAIVRRVRRWDPEDFGEVHDGVARDRERQARLPFCRSLAVGDQQRRDVEYCGPIERDTPSYLLSALCALPLRTLC